jgi:hypothetical protein
MRIVGAENMSRDQLRFETQRGALVANLRGEKDLTAEIAGHCNRHGYRRLLAHPEAVDDVSRPAGPADSGGSCPLPRPFRALPRNPQEILIAAPIGPYAPPEAAYSATLNRE